MRMKIVQILFLGCLLVSGGAVRADETALIDRELGNGDFETGSLDGWFITNNSGGVIESYTGNPKNGKQVFHVKIKGKPDGRALSGVFQNVAAVDPANGRKFVLKFDTKSVADHLVPDIAVEIVLFKGDEVIQTLTFEPSASDSTEWASQQLNANEVASEAWTGGKIQLRISFLKDGGEDGVSYELLIDNVKLIQKP